MKKGKTQEIAVERMFRLIELAEQEWKNNPERSTAYIQLIKKLSTRNKAKIPNEIKAKFCKKCNAFWTEGKNVTKRITAKQLRIICRECNAVKKINLKKQ